MQITNKKEIPQNLNVTIEKLSNLGHGIAKIDGYVIFVTGACPGDILKIKITKKNKNFAYADIDEIIEPSQDRIEPFCKMQKICGACQLQFIKYEKQLKLKKEIVEDTMRNIYGYPIKVKDVIKSPKEKEYRCKIQYPISETKNSKRIIAGYYKQNSHEIVNIKFCPIQPKQCDDIIEYIRNAAKECNISGYTEKNHKGTLRHILIRNSAYNNEKLIVLVINSTKISENIIKLGNKIYSELKNIAGVVVNFNDKKTNLILGEKSKTICGQNYIKEKLCGKIFKIGAKTFFQVNPFCADTIFNYVKKYIDENFTNPDILDAYAGISAFGISLSDIASHITTIEENPESVQLANEIISENNIKNINVFCDDAGKFFEKLSKDNKKFDLTILDPPRKGCSEESLDFTLKLTKKTIIYVSCNPATLARDLKYLKNKGCTISFIQPFDMFPHTYHIENAVIISLP